MKISMGIHIHTYIYICGIAYTFDVAGPSCYLTKNLKFIFIIGI